MQNSTIFCLGIAGAFFLTSASHAQRPASRLDTVRVTVTSRAQSSLITPVRSVQVITREEIARLPVRTIAELLASTTGGDVESRSDMQADLAIRGASAGQVLVLVDGVRASDRQTAHFDLDLPIPLSSIERIEILRGAGSAMYGADAVGGVVNIVTRRDAPMSAEARGGSFGFVGGALSMPGISVEHDRSDGQRDGTDYRVTQAYASIGSATNGLRVGQAVRDFGANTFYGPYDSHERTATTTAALRGERALSSAFAIDATIATRRHVDQFTLYRTNPSAYRNRHVGWQSSVTTVAHYVPADIAVPLATALGAELSDAQLSSNRLGGRRERTGALFGQATLGRLHRATADVGLRTDWSDGFGTFVSPTLAGSLPVARDRVWLRASASRALRAPTWTERYYSDPANVGNADLQAERFEVGEVGVRAYPSWGGSLDVAAWGRRATDVIDWVKPASAPSTTVWTATNIGKISYRGVDGELSLPAWGVVDVAAHGSLLRFTADSAGGIVGKYALRPLTSQAGLRVGVARIAMLDAVYAKRAGDQSSHVLVNARAMRERGRATVALDFRNLGGADYLDASGKPIAGRSINGSVIWR